MRTAFRLATGGLVMLSMALLSCAGKRPDGLGVTDQRMAACPASPNCVSSDARDDAHRIDPFRLAAPAHEAWNAARESVLALPRTRIVDERDDYLHAECSSRVFGFVDDLELHLRPGDGVIAVRSASRLGHSDLGVNRKRVESLRQALVRRGVAEPAP